MIDLYEFLIEAIRQTYANENVEKHFSSRRGLKEYVNGEYKYSFKVEGDLEYFDGEECIFKDEKKIYELKCHGGMIK